MRNCSSADSILSLIGALPDTHLLRFLNQLLAEIRMRNRDQSLRTLPCSQTLEVYLAVLGDKPVRARTGIGNDRSVLERRTNTALERAVLLLKGGRAADEALAALGQIRAQNEVQLATCTGNLL